MAKNLLFGLFFISTCLFSASIEASNRPIPPQFQGNVAEECTAPAPGNFRITDTGTDFIDLAWDPAWNGATHTLAVLESDGMGGWQALDTLYNVPGSAHTVYNLTSGTLYRFIIATNCNTGEPSVLKAIIDGITLILDLTINVRQPALPLAVECDDIPLNFSWVGFKVTYIQSGVPITNYFEFKGTNGGSISSNFFDRVEIGRTFEDHPIVAVDPVEDWPKCDVPSLRAEKSFRMDRLINGGPNREKIGWVDYSQNSGSSISLCPDYNHSDLPWKSEYTFTALIAPKGSLPPICEERSENILVDTGDFTAQNPFNETLNIFLPATLLKQGPLTLRLSNTTGQTVLEQRIETTSSQISIPISAMATGCYILYIQVGTQIRTKKIVKL